MNNLITKESMNSMSLEAIENYGSDIQLTISDQMTSMLKHTKAIDLDQTGKSLSDLSVETGAISKKMSATLKTAYDRNVAASDELLTILQEAFALLFPLLLFFRQSLLRLLAQQLLYLQGWQSLQ